MSTVETGQIAFAGQVAFADYHLSCGQERTFSGAEKHYSEGTPKSGGKYQM